MPELPEVETSLRGISPHILRQKITRVTVRNHRLRWPIPTHIAKTLVGQTIQQLVRRAKYMIFQCDEGCLLLHLGMSGRVRILNTTRPPEKHDHVDIECANGKILRFTDPRRFGALLWTKDDPNQHPLLAHLGPEPLSDEFSAGYIFNKAKHRAVPIKSFIMDSKIVVGVGNIYAAEALFEAGIHPLQPAGKIGIEKCMGLVKAIKRILASAIKQGGTTLKDFTQSDGKPGYFRVKLKVYGREGEACPSCNQALQLLKIGQRSSVFCVRCQPLT